MIKDFNSFNEDKKVNYEIERRFLLEKLPNIEFDEVKMISQYYGVDPVGNFRVREEKYTHGFTYFITRKKYVSEGINEEDEKTIDKMEFDELKSKTNSHISKKRHILYLDNGLKWEVDSFLDFDMVVAEIEIPQIDYRLDIPEEIKSVLVEEITHRKDLSNFALSIKN